MFNWFKKKYNHDELDVPKVYTKGFVELVKSIQEEEDVWSIEFISYKAYYGYKYYTFIVRDTKRGIEYTLLSDTYDNITTYDFMFVTFNNIGFTKEEQDVVGKMLFNLYEHRKQKENEETLSKLKIQQQKELDEFLSVYGGI